MTQLNLTAPLTFEPIFMERIWGGRRLESQFGKRLPPGKQIGEAWEISDRPEAQSLVRNGPLLGKSLHELWIAHRKEVFGESPKTARESRALPDRFPLLIKLLDARDKLSLQVHPPENVARDLGGEAKTEFWYVAAAEPGAELLVGLREPTSADKFKQALETGAAAEHVHKIPVKAGDAMFLPSGRFHAIGGGNLLVEIQQNSDTTYRVFDWNRVDEDGRSRELHVDQALQCIDFEDCRPGLVQPEGELLVRNELFEVQKWDLAAARDISPQGEFAIAFCLTGAVHCGGVDLRAGEFFLIPASSAVRQIRPVADGTSILRITIPR
ncbi:MAG: mannose-6-phosphate isomerase [Verrucomicrobiota bacterium]|jgi:mannose-6-phosphate isomerase